MQQLLPKLNEVMLVLLCFAQNNLKNLFSTIFAFIPFAFSPTISPKLIFWIWCDIGFKLHFPPTWMPITPATFLAEIALSPLNFMKVKVYVGVCFWTCYYFKILGASQLKSDVGPHTCLEGKGRLKKEQTTPDRQKTVFIIKGTSYEACLGLRKTSRFPPSHWNLKSLYRGHNWVQLRTIWIISTKHCSLKPVSLKTAPTVGTMGKHRGGGGRAFDCPDVARCQQVVMFSKTFNNLYYVLWVCVHPCANTTLS